MISCIVGMMIGILGYFVFQKKKKKTIKTGFEIIGIFSMLGLFAYYMEHSEMVQNENEGLLRQENGAGDYEVELELSIGDVYKTDQYIISVPEQRMTPEEEQVCLKEAEQEIEETFPGENESANEIRNRVKIFDSYQNGRVTAEWTFDNYSVIDTEGIVKSEAVPEEGTTVGANVILTCEDSSETYQFFFCVYPEILTEQEKILKKLNEELTNNKEKEGIAWLKIPEELDGNKITWKQKRAYLPEKLVLFGLVIAGFVPLLEYSRKKEAWKKRQMLLKIEYPDMVSKLTLLLGAGMTFQGAWKKVATMNSDERNKKAGTELPVYEEMMITLHEIESGVSEQKAYERFGSRCGLRNYRKFSSLITQNIKKGNRNLIRMLEVEVEDAFEERKNLARAYGEEAGTKLLLPMMIMFSLVILIIMIPAFLSFRV